MIPFWIATGFQTLGWVFVLFVPFGLTSTPAYLGGILLGVLTALWTKRVYVVTVVERTESGLFFSIRRRRNGDESGHGSQRYAVLGDDAPATAKDDSERESNI